MQLKNVRRYLLLAVLTLCIFLPSYQAFAEEGGAGFTVQSVLPASQLDDGNTYFDLNLQPGEKEVLGIELVNNSDSEKKIQISAHSAFTNVNGVVEYSKTIENYDPSLKYFMNELIEIPDVVTLQPNEKRIVDLNLTMPEEAFEGILAGGIKIQEVPEEADKKAEQSEGGFAIENRYAYEIGVVLSNRRDIITSELELADVYPDQVNARNVVTALIQNTYPTYVNQIAIDATVTRAGDKDVFAEVHKENMQMAPNSDFAFPIELLEGQPFKSGTYTVDMTTRSKEQEWHWTKEFTISAEVAKRLNEKDVYVDDSTDWKMIVLSICVALLLIAVAYLIYRNRQQVKVSKEEEE